MGVKKMGVIFINCGKGYCFMQNLPYLPLYIFSTYCYHIFIKMKKFFNKYIFIFLGVLAFWVWVIPFLFAKALPVICENITYNSSYDVVVEKPRLVLNVLPVAVVKADSLKVKKKESSDFVFVTNAKIKLRILPLLSGNLHVNKISASNLEFSLKLPENPELDKDFFKKLEKQKVKFDCVELSRLSVRLNEKQENPIFFDGKNIRYRKNSRYFAFFIDSRMKLDNKQSDLYVNLFLPRNNDIKKSNIDIKANNIDVAPLCDFFNKYMPKDLVDVQGIINIDANKSNLKAKLNNFKIIKKDDSNSIYFPDELNITSDFSLTRKLISIANADIISKNINTSFSGTISDYLGKTRTSVNLNLRINNSKVEDIIRMMPPIQTIDLNGYKLKKYKFYGDVIGNLNIKGDCIEPSVNGNVYITNGVLTTPIPNAKGASIKLKFLGKYVNFDVTVPASAVEKVFVKGGVELYNVKYSDMRIWSTKSVDLAVAQSKVVPLHEILNFIIGPVPIMDINGIGNIDIKVKGNRKDPHIWGEFNVEKAKAFFLEMADCIVNNGDVSLTFDDENVTFKLNKGSLNGKPIGIRGTSTLSGKFDFDINSDNQNLAYLYKAIKNSSMVDDIKSILPDLDIVNGIANIKLKIYGNIKDIHKIKFKENFFVKGSIQFLGNDFGMNGLKIANTKGKANFEDTSINFETDSLLGKSEIKASGKVKDDNADILISSENLNLNDILVKKDAMGNILLKVIIKYCGKTNKIEAEKVNLNAKIIKTLPNNKINISNGELYLKNGKLTVKNMNGYFENVKNSFNLNFTADRVLTNPNVSGKIHLKDFELPFINKLQECVFVPKEVKEIIKQVRFEKGKINLKADIWNNNINASTDIGGVELTYLPAEMPIRAVNGSIYLRRNFLGLDKINLLVDGMPILVDGGINNILSKQNFDIYINSKPQQGFIDKYFNNNHIYPLKIKGDIVYQIRLKGTKDNFDVISQANMARSSSIYYLGATVGDLENAIFLNLDMNVLKNKLYKIKELSYDKIIDSQNSKQTRLNMLKVYGGIEIDKDNINFNNLQIKTHNPTDAKIFNIIFKKPNIKQGQFTSDLRINGSSKKPRIIGSFHIFETDIPFMDTVLKNITLIFRDRIIEFSSLGEVLGNDLKFKGKLRNELKLPLYIEDAELTTKIIDMNYITDRLKEAQVNEIDNFESLKNLDLRYFVIKNVKMNANSIKLRNLFAENVEANASFNEKRVLTINNFKFNLANGELNGSFSHNFENGKTALKLNAGSIDANAITYAVFDLNNQIYGELTGDIDLACTGFGYEKCMETVSGYTTFNVSNGRMPKLGSLEYLLRAGNLVKGGLTNLSINGIVDIISPMKTGDFSSIYGVIDIKDGVAENIEISTKGNDLSLFITGQYNFATANAEMEVLGLLSKKISTLFGPIGNVSINSLFNVIPGIDLSKDTALRDKINKIPGIELSSKAYRKFVAEIFGNISGDDYVQTFQWIN